jgi:hypothetical protein
MPALTAAGMPRTELTNLARLLDTARQGTNEGRRLGKPTELPPGDWPRVPPAPEIEKWAQGTDAAGGLLDNVPDPPRSHEGPDDEQDLARGDGPAPENRLATLAANREDLRPAAERPEQSKKVGGSDAA